METVQVEVWVIVDADGDYAVGSSMDDAGEAFDDNIGGHSPRRAVKVTLTVPKPKAVELVGTVPAEVEGGELRVA
jgi:hypothetical protein